jgi:Protein of unknown function (DUF1549)/Protein of unknown function (DUF1553)
MWKRNLLFIALIGGGTLALGANLMPPRQAKAITRYDAVAYQDADFREAVAKVDASFRDSWVKEKTPSAPAAADLAVARRLALGLMGTVPSLEEIRQFEWLPAEERLSWWVDHILQDRRFADYFAERLARASVGTEDGPFIFYRRRRYIAWLGDQLAKARPYDEVVRDLIASEGLWTDRPATNFVSVTAKPDAKNQPDPVRLAGRVTRAFLGLRLDCAECHNHPYAAWKQTDFQSLAAFFGQAHIGFTGVSDGPGEFEAMDKKTQEKRAVEPRVPFAPELLPEEGSRRHRLAAWVTDRRNPYFARATVNRVWALMLGRPLVDPVDNLESDVPVPAALQILADDFAAHDFDLRRLIRLIACSEVFRLDSAADRDLTEEDEKVWAAFPLTRLRPEQVVGGIVQSSSVTTIDAESHLLIRLIRLANHNDFVKRYGDSGEDEFGGRGGTIPQRLLMMNGTLIGERIKQSPFSASTRIAWFAPDGPRAVETAYLAVLTRRPTSEEATYFEKTLANKDIIREQHLEDLFWALINSTEASWNH